MQLVEAWDMRTALNTSTGYMEMDVMRPDAKVAAKLFPARKATGTDIVEPVMTEG